ncbi:hypothetical protein EV714DRAFT_278035 [Schizophyllum commune]
MTTKNFTDYVGCRTLRNGKTFSQYYIVPNKNFNLDAHGLAAAARERDEPPPPAADDGDEDDWEDIDALSPLSSAPPTPPATSAAPSTTSAAHSRSPSPLSSLSSLSSSSRASARSLRNPPTQHAVSGTGRKRRRKEHGRRNRAKKRKAGTHAPTLRDRVRHQARRVANAEAQIVSIDLDDVPVASTGFRGLYEEEIHQTYTRKQLVEKHDFVYFPWDGRDTTPFVTTLPADPPDDDDDGTSDGEEGASIDDETASDTAQEHEVVIGCLAGRPSDGEGSGRSTQPTWDETTATVADAIEAQRSRATFGKAACVHRRGCFGAQACGISHGGGQICPGNLKHSVAMTLVLMYLIALPAMVRIAHFASGAFAQWAPAIHHYYGETLIALLASDPALSRNFPASVWASITINFGPRTVCYPHRDYANLPFGWCAITALGNYDPDKGGDLVLWDCKMVIRFPPGSTILIPSAILRHSNTTIGKGERRYSVTQYTAGAIFRWVEHGFQLDEKYYASLSRAERAKDRQTAASRWRRGRAMFSRLDDLVADAEAKLNQ